MPGFAGIRARAAVRKGGEGELQSLLGPRLDNALLTDLADDRVLSTMAGRIFSAGFVWRVIELKWPGFEEAFLGFEPKRLIFQPDDFWHQLTADSRIVRHPQKIFAIRENALFVERMAAEHGSFGTFLAGWPKDDQIGLAAYLASHGSRLGGATAQFFLRWVGWDTFILSRDVVAALRDSGLEIAASPTAKRDLARIQEQMNAWAGETGLSYGQLSRILAMSIGENHAPAELRAYQGE